MRYNVGIDFGTHQTKVCIEDALNKRVPVYEFLEYSKPDGTKTVLLPSIVQINKDHTVSYGFANQDDTLLKRPDYKKTGYLTVLEKFLPISETIKKWKHAWFNSKQEAEQSTEQLQNDWERRGEVAEDEYSQQYAEGENDVQQSASMRFRYFKQASFYPNSTSWHYSYAPETLSTLYLAYICLCIRKRIGYDFTVQLGAPLGASKRLSKQQRHIAKDIWNKAVFLANKYQLIDRYLKASIEELTNSIGTSQIESSPLTVIPEASAGLLAIRDKLGTGSMFLLVDIGGGTTDIALCSVDSEKTIGIHKVFSMNKGLNYVFEEYQKKHADLSISTIHNIFQEANGKKDFSQSINNYHTELHNKIEQLVNAIISSFLSANRSKGYDRSNIEKAMNRKPIYLCGGGSIYDKMREFSTTDLYFSDKNLINKFLLNVEHIGNAGGIPDELYPILATSYGLAKQIEMEEIDEKPLENFFNHLPSKPTKQPAERTPENDYSLARGTW